MKAITFECETITPMFLGGADERTPELRAPTIKGAMRFWWRAMNGHLLLKELKEREAKIFGTSDERIGQSKFSIRILSDSLQTEEYPPFPHRNFKFNGISPNQKISIILSSQYKNINECSDILKVSLILGGLGKRVRRGFGCVRILNVGSQSHNNVEYELENILKLVNDIGDNKYKIGTGDKIELKVNLTAQYPFLKEIQLGKEYDSWEELLKKVGETSHNHNIDSLGFAKDNKRLASPVYVSVLKNPNNKYLPIISTLNTVFEDRRTIEYGKQNAFKGAIL